MFKYINKSREEKGMGLETTQTIELIVSPGVPRTGTAIHGLIAGSTKIGGLGSHNLALLVAALTLILCVIGFLLYRHFSKKRSRRWHGRVALFILVPLLSFCAVNAIIAKASDSAKTYATSGSALTLSTPQIDLVAGAETSADFSLTSNNLANIKYTILAKVAYEKTAFPLKIYSAGESAKTLSGNAQDLITTDDDNLSTKFKLSADAQNLAPGVYTAKITYAIREDEAAMQTFSSAQCHALNIYTGQNSDALVHLKDMRDGKYYWVGKLADGNCWMLQNLALDGSGMLATTDPSGKAKTPVTTLDSSNTNFKSSGSLAQIAMASDTNSSASSDIATLPTAYNYGSWSFTNPSIYIPDGAALNTDDHKESSLLPSTYSESYGYLYNWCAAMGSQANACAPNSVNTGVQPQYEDICPKGWHIPTGDVGGEYSILTDALGVGSSYIPGQSSSALDPMLTVFHGVFAGFYYTSPSLMHGWYWSSTLSQSEGNHTYFLSIDGSGTGAVTGTSAHVHNYGFAVRCME
jgi:uncharacterized protein (TIGR02145 family)